MKQPSLNLDLNPNEWAIIKNIIAMRANGDRLIILEDDFNSGYECTQCGGLGHTGKKCPHCRGTGLFKGRAEDGPCPDCRIGTDALAKSLGYVLCPLCNGQGSTIIIPDESKRRPPTGRVIAVGRDVTEFAVGNHVMYTNYTGTDFELMSGVKLRIMKQHDVMCEIKKFNKNASMQDGGMRDEIAQTGVTTQTK